MALGGLVKRLLTRAGTPVVVAGVDVGSPRNGFHAVAFRDGAYLDRFKSSDPGEVAQWCGEVGAVAVGVDSPCGWNSGPGSRPAERELAKERISSFPTPTREVAGVHPKGNYDWMFAGEALYSALAATHPLYRGEVPVRTPASFETFPQAAACALAGERVSAKEKGTVRRELLSRAGLDIAQLTNIDWVDAALCALTAAYLVNGDVRTYGEAETGTIVVPGSAIR